MTETALITGSGGLIGSEACQYFLNLGWNVIGIDNNMREYFFGPEASTESSVKTIESTYSNYTHYTADIRDEQAVETIFRQHQFNLIIHTAAQPSHDWAKNEPLTDFDINARATLILLEKTRLHSPEAVFLFTSTNKVYGDTPNTFPFVEQESRYELPKNHQFVNGFTEELSIDHSKHSLFGASKVAADIFVQEYGRYFDMKTTIFRAGCLTGSGHKGAPLHGFLSYLGRAIHEEIPYTIYGYKGKQVRDNIHSHDVITAFHEVYKNPRSGAVYNIGGGRHSNVSMLEAIDRFENILNKKAHTTYSDIARSGDHQWYISDMTRFQQDYPEWTYSFSLDDIFDDIARKLLA